MNRLVYIFIILSLTFSSLKGGEEFQIESSLDEKCKSCDLFKKTTIHEKPNNFFIQELKFHGRYHGQWYYVDGNDLGSDSDWDNRRWRLGLKAKVFNSISAKATLNLNTEKDLGGRFVDSFDSFSLSWEFSDYVKLELGKLLIGVTREHSTSSKDIHTIERSLIINQIAPDKSGGILLKSKFKDYDFKFGIFSGSVNEDYNIPNFNGEFGVLSSLGFNGFSNSEIRFDYFYSEFDEDNNNFENYKGIFSLNTKSKWGNFGLESDMIYAIGDTVFLNNSSDVYGLILLTYYDLIKERLRLVLRYNYSGSDDSTALRLQKRYDRKIENAVKLTGDVYQSLYLGINIFLCENNLKLLNGIQYSSLEGGESDYEGFSFMSGVRLYF